MSVTVLPGCKCCMVSLFSLRFSCYSNTVFHCLFLPALNLSFMLDFLLLGTPKFYICTFFQNLIFNCISDQQVYLKPLEKKNCFQKAVMMVFKIGTGQNGGNDC